MPPSRRRAGEGPSGATVLRKLKASLLRGVEPGLTVLTGEDLFHLDAAQKALLSSLVPAESPEFALTVYGDGRLRVDDLVAAARSMPMFAERRVVLVREVGSLEGEESALIAYSAKPPRYSFLLVRAPKLDLRRPLHKALAASGTVLQFRPSSAWNDAEILEEVASLASERGLSLDRDVAVFLLEGCARDLHRVCLELDKTAAWLHSDGPSPRVTLPVARQVAATGGILSGWEVADALLARDQAAAIVALRKLIEAGEEPIRILGGLAWRARTLLQAKAMTESGATRSEVTSALRAWPYEDRLHAGLARYSLRELLAFPARLLEADRVLKSRSLDSSAVLESLVASLTRREMP